MNKVFLIGNLTRDPELTETSSGVSICRFAIAVNRNYAGSDGERKTDFFNVTAWRGLGETVSRYAKKGNKVAVVGTIELRNYEDSTGAKRTAVPAATAPKGERYCISLESKIIMLQFYHKNSRRQSHLQHCHIVLLNKFHRSLPRCEEIVRGWRTTLMNKCAYLIICMKR